VILRSCVYTAWLSHKRLGLSYRGDRARTCDLRLVTAHVRICQRDCAPAPPPYPLRTCLAAGRSTTSDMRASLPYTRERRQPGWTSPRRNRKLHRDTGSSTRWAFERDLAAERLGAVDEAGPPLPSSRRRCRRPRSSRGALRPPLSLKRRSQLPGSAWRHSFRSRSSASPAVSIGSGDVPNCPDSRNAGTVVTIGGDERIDGGPKPPGDHDGPPAGERSAASDCT
jgi:hypothetical protein